MNKGTKFFIMSALTSAAMGATAAGLTPTATVEGIKSYQLDNGLQVVLFADQSKPTATVNTTYLVGSRHENYGETGMAHLLEHLMFKGSAKHPNPTKEFTRRGFRMNGSTWLDRTNYHVTFTANDDNMRYAIDWSADAMVNSRIARSDLDTEMTVVRNEYEMGENRPTSVMMKRMQSVLFDWHSYGRSTIGARSDIENVPIENLQAFYRRWYQPDNAVLTISGKFDEEKVLAWVQETFGRIPRPTRALPQEWTVEPVADGPRYFEIRRPGEMKLVAVGYRIPSAIAADSNAVETAVDVLGDSPKGRLYKALVETGKAGQVFGWALSAKCPGFALFGAIVKKDDPIEPVREILIDTIENAFAKNGATKEEVELSIADSITEFERTLSDPEEFAVDLSEYIALGDWRLFFADRDSNRKVTAEDVNKAASTYFVRDNRVVGVFIPDDKPRRAPELVTPDPREVIAKASFKTEGDQAEAFDIGYDNLNARTERLVINGIKVALLPKKTRGQTVNFLAHFAYSNPTVSQNNAVVNMLAGHMLSRGTDTMTRDEIADRKTQLKMQGEFFDFTTTRENVVGAIELLGELTTRASFPQDEVERLVKQLTTSVEGKSDDPVKMARNALSEHFATYPEGDVRNSLTDRVILRDLKTMTREKLFNWWRDVMGTGIGEVAVVGDFDPAAVRAALQKVLGKKQPADEKARYERAISEYRPVAPKRITIDAPQKDNAVLLARCDFPANRDDADTAALMLANHILGGGSGLSNRLVDRLRQKDGLSYSVASQLQVPTFGNRAIWMGYAITAPQNLARAESAMREEITRAIAQGVTQKELDEAKKGLLEQRTVGRAQDVNLVNMWTKLLERDRDFSHTKELDARIQAATLEEVNQAMRKITDNGALTFVLSGDEAAAAKQGASFMNK